MKSLCAIAIGVFAASLAFGRAAATNQSSAPSQAASSKLEFEVASIRPVQPTDPNRVDAGLRMDGAQAHFGALSIKNLIARAYRVQPSLITGPDWISSDRFDITAKLPDGATTDQIPEMLQSLLAERFGLKIHFEKKDLPAYALVLGKSPLKLKELTPDAEEQTNTGGAVNVAVSGSAQGVSMDLGNGSSFTFADDQFQFTKVTMDIVALELARFLDRPVVNMTGLQGNYNLTLPVTQEDYYILLVRSGANAGVTLPPRALQLLNGTPVSLFDALDAEGLRLDSRKLPLDTIVVDQALQTPTDN
jgi:uncharacterized protein (TIGR03435 family)